LASGGRLELRRRRRTPIRGERAPKDRGPAGKGPRREKSTARRGEAREIDRAPAQIAASRGKSTARESFTASAGEGRGREKAADGPRPPLGCSSARVHRPAAPAAEPALHFRWPVRPCSGAAPASSCCSP
jgi:hypothetical protein